MTTSLPLSVRIVADSSNSDGWVSKLLPSSTVQDTDIGKIAFIANLNSTIQELVPGQVWEASLISAHPTYWIVQLLSRVS